MEELDALQEEFEEVFNEMMLKFQQYDAVVVAQNLNNELDDDDFLNDLKMELRSDVVLLARKVVHADARLMQVQDGDR